MILIKEKAKKDLFEKRWVFKKGLFLCKNLACTKNMKNWLFKKYQMSV